MLVTITLIKKASELTLEEAIILAGIPKSPENYNPVSNYDASIKRAKIVAEAMYKNKKLMKRLTKIYSLKKLKSMVKEKQIICKPLCIIMTLS